jgi:hypothetical protein
MTARTTKAKSHLSVADETRTFQIVAGPPTTKGTYGLRVFEAYGPDARLATLVVNVGPAQTARVADVIIATARRAGHRAAELTAKTGGAITLDEAAGVRLCLTLLATQPITRGERIRALVAGIDDMSVEETYYWYAKCVGPRAAAARKAIRILLADDQGGHL